MTIKFSSKQPVYYSKFDPAVNYGDDYVYKGDAEQDLDVANGLFHIYRTAVDYGGTVAYRHYADRAKFQIEVSGPRAYGTIFYSVPIFSGGWSSLFYINTTWDGNTYGDGTFSLTNTSKTNSYAIYSASWGSSGPVGLSQVAYYQFQRTNTNTIVMHKWVSGVYSATTIDITAWADKSNFYLTWQINHNASTGVNYLDLYFYRAYNISDSFFTDYLAYNALRV